MTTLSHCRPDASCSPGECNICDYYQTFFDKKHQFPHCDAYVVHESGICEVCDGYASDLQEWRKKNNVNFTGENDSDKKPCPATTRRKASTIHKWHGNVPSPKSCDKCGSVAVYINMALSCPKHGPV